jgi:hypothetical protein
MKKIIQTILREGTSLSPKNSLGFEVTRPNQILTVMRGISGSGRVYIK